MASGQIRALFTARDGAVWIGNLDRGLVRHAGGRFTAFGREQGLSHPAVFHVTQTLPQFAELWIERTVA